MKRESQTESAADTAAAYAKYIVRTYVEGCQPDSGIRCDTLAEARARASRTLTNDDEARGRKMRKHPHVIDDEMDGYAAFESWTAQGKDSNESDYTTIFRVVADGRAAFAEA